MHLSIRILGLELITIDASTDATDDGPGDVLATPVGFTPSTHAPREPGRDTEPP